MPTLSPDDANNLICNIGFYEKNKEALEETLDQLVASAFFDSEEDAVSYALLTVSFANKPGHAKSVAALALMRLAKLSRQTGAE